MAHQIPQSLNCPEENDETLSEQFQSDLLMRQKTSSDHAVMLRRMADGQTFIHHNLTQSCGKLIQRDQLPRYDQQTPYPSQIHSERADLGAHWGWHYSATSPQPSSLPSYLPSTEYQTYPGAGCSFPNGCQSLPHSLSLEQPGSLHSFPPAGPSVHTHRVIPIPGLHCAQYGPVPLHVVPQPHLIPISGYRQPYRLTGPENYRYPDVSKARRVSNRPKQTRFCSTQLSHEQRKVFVTYEADNEAHLKEVIKFVALLRNNGFDTHIDVFEQQLYSISKIDCMERYLNEKDYLIIIVISLKYFETVTGAVDCDERTSNTVYIHKQLQSEFIQNGCKNFRVIPVLFPGAKNSYVPTWLQNTQLYSWPRDRDDILRRLMRVEKYNPPPVGPLPTIVTRPI